MDEQLIERRENDAQTANARRTAEWGNLPKKIGSVVYSVQTNDPPNDEEWDHCWDWYTNPRHVALGGRWSGMKFVEEILSVLPFPPSTSAVTDALVDRIASGMQKSCFLVARYPDGALQESLRAALCTAIEHTDPADG